MGKVIRLLILVVVLSAAVFGAYAWFASRSPEEAAYEVFEVQEGAITDKALAVGQIVPRYEFRVKSKISGIVKESFVEVGDVVHPGDPLFEILPDPTPAELVQAQRRVESAQAAFARAESEYGRVKQLVEEGIQARDQLDRSFESHEQARIELEQARDQLDLVQEGRIARGDARLESIIRAPSGGILLSRAVNPGDPVVPLTSYQAGTEMAVIADMSDLLFKGTVDEIDVGKLRAGLPARLKVGALPEAPVVGDLVRIAPQAIEKEGAKLFEVEIELGPSGDVVLRAGYSATADLVIREKTGIVVVPERLVHFSEEGSRTWVELEPELPGVEPPEREVEVGLSDGLQIEIVSGLEPGDRIIERAPRDVVS